MNAEHVMLIDVDALASVRIECNKCHAAYSFRIADKVEPPFHCFACREPFGDTGLDAIRAVHALMDAFGAWTRAQSSGAAKFTVRFEMLPMMHAAPRQPPKA